MTQHDGPEYVMRWAGNGRAVDRRPEESLIDAMNRCLMHSAAEAERARVALDRVVAAGVPLKYLRRDAIVVIRCDDCARRPIALVTLVDGRPLLWVSWRRGNGDNRLWIDDTLTSQVSAACRTAEYIIDIQGLRRRVLTGGREEVRVGHALTHTVLYAEP